MKKSKLSLSSKFVGLLMVVIALNGYAYYSILHNIYLEQLKAQAQTVVSNVEAFGAWVAGNGRVWVKDKDNNSFLSKAAFHPEGAPDSTVHFYSKNPALAQREFSEVVARSDSPAKFRMTSLNVMNPVNAPDEFEITALNSVKNSGKKEYYDFVGGSYRYAKAIYHSESCIGCHGDPAKAPADVISRYGEKNGFGFMEGDLAGVISVTIPSRKLYFNVLSFVGVKEIVIVIFSIFIVLLFVRIALINPIKKLTSAAHDISTGKETPINIDGIAENSRNEIHQLSLALNRMRTSSQVAIKKMREAEATTKDILAKAKAAIAKLKRDNNL
ncbi:MAG: DUF3365 domain-containing protein [Marinagarivorans sp.]|nr:DUF3365 domain-containing protein [Marinagarivorans sp.]